MSEDIALKILSQTSENIQKLFDFSNRIDERVKTNAIKTEELEDKVEGILANCAICGKEIAVLQVLDKDKAAIVRQVEDLKKETIEEMKKEMVKLDKRLSAIESIAMGHQDKIKMIAGFVVQLIWVVLAAYILYKLNLSPPAVP